MAVQIVVNKNLEERQKYIADFLESLNISNTHPDVLYFEDDSKLGVNEAKQIRDHLSLKPFSFDKRIILLESADSLTLDAQNSLLKTLEEPPIASEIILAVKKLDNLLDTVISRCEIINLSKTSTQQEESASDIEEFINKNTTERFKQIEKMEDRDKFLEGIILYYREKLYQGQKVTKLLDELLTMQQWIYSHVNDRAILEYAALVIPVNKIKV